MQYYQWRKSAFWSLSVLALMCSCASNNNDGSRQAVPSIPAPFLSPKKVTEVPEEQSIAIAANDSFYTQNEIYRQIAEGVARHGILSSEYNLLGARYNHELFRRSVLPQVTPASSIDDDGNVIFRLLIEQVIFDGGRFKAGNKILDAEQAVAFAEFAIEYSERISTAVDAYFRQYMHSSFTQASEDYLKRYSAFQEMARRRLEGGVGSQSELGIFELKQAEAQADLSRDIAETEAAKLELQSLIGKPIAISPPLIDFGDLSGNIPPIVARAIAESNIATGELSAERAESLPRLSVRGSVGAGTSQGLGFDDRINSYAADLQLSKPLTWGSDYGLKAAGAAVDAANAVVEEERRDADLQLRVLDIRIANLTEQLQISDTLAQQAKSRVDDFEKQFLGGAVGIVEAVGIIDTYKRIVRSQIESRFNLLSAQREKVQFLGLLGPYKQLDDPDNIDEASSGVSNGN